MVNYYLKHYPWKEKFYSHKDQSVSIKEMGNFYLFAKFGQLRVNIYVLRAIH